jgi:hypothetical protein
MGGFLGTQYQFPKFNFGLIFQGGSFKFGNWYCVPISASPLVHALSLGAVLVTHNTRELGRISGLAVEDWLA